MFHSNRPNWWLVTLHGATNRTLVPDRIVSSEPPATSRRTALTSPTSFAYVMWPPNHVRHAENLRIFTALRRPQGRSLIAAESEAHEAPESTCSELLVHPRHWMVRHRRRQDRHRRPQRSRQ